MKRLYQAIRIETNYSACIWLLLCAMTGVFLCAYAEPIWARRALALGAVLLFQAAPMLAVAFGPEKNEHSVLCKSYWMVRYDSSVNR
ncbi:MAG: hypothetical protein WC835_01200 [Candidatus Paceibacterota bacterium]|jgi:hypothetical protein